VGTESELRSSRHRRGRGIAAIHHSPKTHLPYVERAVTEALYERVLVLHVLWKAGIVTDAYAEARLDELSDLCSRKASIEEGYGGEVQETEDTNFGAQFVEVMSDKGITRAELARRTGISITSIGSVESSSANPQWNTVQALAEALNVDLTEFLPRRSDGKSEQR
jgi:DNA-binding XRE family transcriptional regulator